MDKILLGIEPTGYYWKPMSNYLVQQGIKVVLVTPYYIKRAKELDDNSLTKNDQKDALTIARMSRDGRFYELYMLHDVFAELRVLSNARINLMKRHNALKR